MGWERPNWFAPEGTNAEDVYSFDRQNWFQAVGQEHQTCREQVALFDASSFAKFMVTGPDAEAALSWICANDVSKPPAKVIYTQMLNTAGAIECDLTATRLATDRYYIVTGTGFVTHDFSWISRNIPNGMDVQVSDVTANYATLSLMGPHAREVLQRVTQANVSNGAFPFGTMQEIDIARAPVRALRITYVGELGWELHVPVKHAERVYDQIMQTGKAYGIANAGYRAIESLRLEKGYRAWGADIGPDYTPIEAGLSWAVKLRSDIPFQGREALTTQRHQGITKRLACFTIEDRDAVLLGRETIYRDNQRVGWLTSAGWGYTVGKDIGYGYVRHADGVDNEFLRSGRYELEIATERVPAQLHLDPLYDPKMLRIKC
jgi:4-methylaminobutanoate oxidase (formaldehyde-forming)